MANNATLDSLVERTLDLADMTSSSFPVRKRVEDLINEGLSEVHESLTGLEYKWKSHLFSGSPGTESYDLPGDFYKLHKLWRLSSGRRFPVNRYTISDLAGHRSNGPQSADNYEMWYIPEFSPLTAGSDRVDPVLHYGWEMYAVYHAAVQLLNREESPTAQSYAMERARLMKRITEAAAPRDQGEADAIEDHYGRWNMGTADDDRRSVLYRVMGREIFLSEFDYLGA